MTTRTAIIPGVLGLVPAALAVVGCAVLPGGSAMARPGTEWHVAPGGDDANPGTSEQPFATQEDYADKVRWKTWT